MKKLLLMMFLVLFTLGLASCDKGEQGDGPIDEIPEVTDNTSFEEFLKKTQGITVEKFDEALTPTETPDIQITKPDLTKVALPNIQAKVNRTTVAAGQEEKMDTTITLFQDGTKVYGYESANEMAIFVDLAQAQTDLDGLLAGVEIPEEMPQVKPSEAVNQLLAMLSQQIGLEADKTISLDKVLPIAEFKLADFDAEEGGVYVYKNTAFYEKIVKIAALTGTTITVDDVKEMVKEAGLDTRFAVTYSNGKIRGFEAKVLMPGPKDIYTGAHLKVTLDFDGVGVKSSETTLHLGIPESLSVPEGVATTGATSTEVTLSVKTTRESVEVAAKLLVHSYVVSLKDLSISDQFVEGEINATANLSKTGLTATLSLKDRENKDAKQVEFVKGSLTVNAKDNAITGAELVLDTTDLTTKDTDSLKVTVTVGDSVVIPTFDKAQAHDMYPTIKEMINGLIGSQAQPNVQ